MKLNRTWSALLVFAALVMACSAVPAAIPLPFVATPTEAGTATATASVTPTATVTGTATPTLTPTSAETATPTITPTAAILRGRINQELVSCRYGPGAMYLYLYGLREGANQDIVGRTDTGKWVLTKSRGDNKSCWVKASLFDIKGDVMSVAMVYPDKYHIPPSNQGYKIPWDVAAVRVGDQVVITWNSEARRPGDQEDERSVLYVIETWVCTDGKVVFTPIGSFVRQVNVTDEAGCSEPSHGRVYFAEKHGYTGPSAIPWPAWPSPTPKP